MLTGPGAVSHDDALDWANAQYDAFAERRRLEAETEAERRYLDDLRRSAETVKMERKTKKKETAHKGTKPQRRTDS